MPMVAYPALSLREECDGRETGQDRRPLLTRAPSSFFGLLPMFVQVTRAEGLSQRCTMKFEVINFLFHDTIHNHDCENSATFSRQAGAST
jgi:hypothetical protein